MTFSSVSADVLGGLCTDRSDPSHLFFKRRCVCVSVYLVRVSVEVEVLQEASGKLTEQEVVRLVDRPQAPVRVVICTGAGTEWTHCNTHTHTLRYRTVDP